MASHTAARRPSSRQTIDSDDALAMRTAELAAWAQRNARVIMYAAAAAVLLVGGLFWMRVQKARTADRAATAFLEMQSTLPADTTAALRQILTYADRYEGTTDAAVARIQVGETYLRRNQPRQAIPQLRRVAEGSTPVAMQARTLLAAALVQDGKRDEAIRAYLAIADDAELN
ncbi:MAG TPA: tetratricopeptide repeat protein, partial [Longimicrobiaceae bacterium]|nr:tetratricopeptide repeat protein [Longimicrobiaceae bacterium]